VGKNPDHTSPKTLNKKSEKWQYKANFTLVKIVIVQKGQNNFGPNNEF
jgi:hypothetical protein